MQAVGFYLCTRVAPMSSCLLATSPIFSFSQGQHYNSVRCIDDLGEGSERGCDDAIARMMPNLSSYLVVEMVGAQGSGLQWEDQYVCVREKC